MKRRGGRPRKMAPRTPKGRLSERGVKVEPVPGIYFIHSRADNASTKVGVTVNLAARMATLQISNAEPLLVRAFVEFVDADTARIAEKALHRYFSARDKHVRGEWFVLNDNDIALIVRDLRTILGAAIVKWVIPADDHTDDFRRECLDIRREQSKR